MSSVVRRDSAFLAQGPVGVKREVGSGLECRQVLGYEEAVTGKITADIEARRLHERLVSLLSLRYGCLFLTIWALVYGSLALILKESTAVPDWQLGWGCTSALLVLSWAAILARRLAPGLTACRAMLDSSNDAGGLLMAQAEAELTPWLENLRTPRQPNLRWRGQRKVSACFASCCFVGAVFLIPRLDLKGPDQRRLDIRDNVEELNVMIDLMDETGVLDEARRDELREELMKAWKASSGSDPVKTWETLDHVEKSLEQIATDTAAELLQQAGMSAMAEELARALDEALTSEQNAATTAQAIRELAALMDKMGVAGLPGLPKELADAISSLSLSPDQLGQLANCMSNSLGSCSSSIQRMAEAGLIDAESLKLLGEALAKNEQALAEFLDRQGNCDALGELAQCNKPGDGSTNRGRGDAPMTWTNASSEADAAFREQSLAPAPITSLEKSEITGISLVEPSAPDAIVPSTSEGALSGSQAAGGSANIQPVLPKHRGVVSRYFERKQP